MTGRYLSLSCGAEYEVFHGVWQDGKKKETGLMCQRTKCEGIPGAVIGYPYPIEGKHIANMIRLNLWKRKE